MTTPANLLPRFIFPLTLFLFLLKGLGAQILFTETFESQTVGATPTGGQTIRGDNSDTNRLAIILGSGDNIAGTGNALRLRDNNSTTNVSLEWLIVPNSAAQESAVHFSYNFARGPQASSGSSRIHFSAGVYDTNTGPRYGSSGNRIFDVRHRSDGSVQFLTRNPDDNSEINITVGTGNVLTSGNVLDVFANGGLAPINYISPATSASATLAAQSVAYYLNGTQRSTGLIFNPNQAGNQFGRMGFTTISGTTGLDLILDNVQASVIPEPGVYVGLLGLISFAAVLAARRQRRLQP